VAFDGQLKVGADGLSFANAFSHPHVQLRNVERKPRGDRRWNPAIALRYREIRQRFALLRTSHTNLGDLYVSRLEGSAGTIARLPSVPWISNRNPVPLAMPAFKATIPS
jgi:hypothetical protein